MRVNDAVFGVALWLLAAVIFWQLRTFPAMPGQKFGPGLVPGLLATGFLLAGSVLALQGLRERAIDGRLVSVGHWRAGGRLLDGLLVLGGLVVLIGLWNLLGFLIVGSLYTFVLIWRFRGHGPLAALAIAIVACL